MKQHLIVLTTVLLCAAIFAAMIHLSTDRWRSGDEGPVSDRVVE